MQWSKLKTRIKSMICPELKDRVDFYVTSYRESHDGADKVWITVDGERIFDCKHYPHQWAEAEAYYNGLRREQVRTLLRNQEIHSPRNFGEAMRTYLDLPVRDASQSPDPLVKAFALIDRRVGKRMFEKLEISESEHSLVKTFHQLRYSSLDS